MSYCVFKQNVVLKGPLNCKLQTCKNHAKTSTCKNVVLNGPLNCKLQACKNHAKTSTCNYRTRFMLTCRCNKGTLVNPPPHYHYHTPFLPLSSVYFTNMRKIQPLLRLHIKILNKFCKALLLLLLLLLLTDKHYFFMAEGGGGKGRFRKNSQ